jgi:TolA-binding protein
MLPTTLLKELEIMGSMNAMENAPELLSRIPREYVAGEAAVKEEPASRAR